MKELEVVILETALADILSIATYIAEQSKSLNVALAFTDRIEKRCYKIGGVSHIGALRPEFGDGIRLVPFEKSAVVLYRIHEETVEVVRVFYGGQDYDTIMGATGA